MKPRNELTRAESQKLLAEKFGKLAAKNKYHAIPTRVDGIRFHSKAEAAYYRQLVALREHKSIRCFLRQVPFDLPGGIKYRADFLVFGLDGVATIHEVKGIMTDSARLKLRQVEFFYVEPNGPFRLIVIKKGQ